MTAAGRGAWPRGGAGGTLNAKGTGPGPYYVMAAHAVPWVGRLPSAPVPIDVNIRAVHGGVLAIQRALNRRLPGKPVNITGVFGPSTSEATKDFQETVPEKVGVADGVVGPKTCRALFLPDVKTWCEDAGFARWQLVCGIIANESNWDPGAVGYSDQSDLGLAQINGRSHPTITEAERLQPLRAVTFVREYLLNSLEVFDGNERDAVASYNLGVGGARSWIKVGRPDLWTPFNSTTPRRVRDYIDRILSACTDS